MTGTDRMPVFTLKANDRLAAATVEHYRRLCVDGGLDDEAREVEYAVDEMVDWAKRNPELMCWPDYEHVPAEGPAVTRKPSDLWRAVLHDPYGVILALDEAASTVSPIRMGYETKISIVRRTAIPTDSSRLPEDYDPADRITVGVHEDAEVALAERWSQAQAMARGLNAATS